jgi:hypothetical protein
LSRFLESLSAKVHPSPLSIDGLSDLFQDFYTRASSHINTHIATLSSRLSRQDSGSPSGRSAPSTGSRKGSENAEQQMLTATEVVDRKKARRQLEVKRAALEEAVERAVCEKVYDRIYRHRTTDDEERDFKLRSRTAALSLVGIGLKELLMTAEELSEEERARTKEREGEIREWLSSARADIQKMDEERYPLGKLQHLTAAHKSIVEALSKIFPATSSADEILPTLIYTLITSPPESLNVISNLKFIQRFRGSSRIDGETAYCLVNLEAAISFLETVDLSSLRAEEARPVRDRSSSRPTTPHEITPMPLGLSQAPDLTQTPATPPKDSSKRAPSPGARVQRRLSNMIQTQTNKIEAASDAVRESIIDSADQALDTINNTLESSFKFLFGRLTERDPNSPGAQNEPKLPKTLEDARKLVSSPPNVDGGDDDGGSISEASSVLGDENPRPNDATTSNKMSDLFGGRRPLRDRSVDSTQSGGSNTGKRIAFTASSNDGKLAAPSLAPRPDLQITQSSRSAVDSLRDMGNSLNPLNRFANMNVLPRFGRAVSSSASTPVASPIIEQNKQLPQTSGPGRSTSGEVPLADEKGVRAVAALEALRKTTPPVKKFLDAKDAQELKLKEVDELLKEYQRLAGALRSAINY